ncbi:MAG: cyclic nucleotide-binding domain-containing protein [Tannerellaceae bacterium]|jgi:CRP-like cAMP-binding protein|nr:cyclic nucleotide-binding domain-containing protein [Tannerellaceae bacterium]
MENELFDFISQYITLSEEEKKVIVDLNIFKEVKKGAFLLEQGQVSNKSYFVLKGCLRTFYIIDGDEKTTAFYTELEGITPQCAVNNKPSEYYISCAEDSIIISSDSEMEATVFEKFPRFETLCRILSEQLLVNNQTSYDEFKISSPEQRYFNLLKTRPDLAQRVPQHQLASYLGITPQSLSRLRARIIGNKNRKE